MHTLSPGLIVLVATFAPCLVLVAALGAGAWWRERRMRRAMARNVDRLLAPGAGPVRTFTRYDRAPGIR